MKISILLTMLWFLSPVAQAGALDDLDYFYHRVNTFSADFEQVVLDENLNQVEESGGRMWIARPGKFRWDYEPPLEQQIVSDGDRVWVFDVELDQITVRRLDKALGKTPAIMLAGQGDLADSYRLEDRGLHGKISWAALIPKDEEGNFNEIQMGFEDGNLRLLQLSDQLGQITRVVFKNNEVNPEILPTLFDFAPPPGVDVIDDSE